MLKFNNMSWQYTVGLSVIEVNEESLKKTDSQGEVAVSVTPVRPMGSSDPWEFEVELDTHVGSLTSDLKEHLSVQTEGKTYKPSRVTSDAPSGHHIKVLAEFNELPRGAKSLTLNAHQIGDIPERLFEWKF